MVSPLQWSGREVSEQQRHTGLDLVGDAEERRVRRLVVASRGGGIGDAPVRGGGRPGEFGTDLAHLVTQRDDLVEAPAGEAVERLRGAVRDVDTAFGHD